MTLDLAFSVEHAGWGDPFEFCRRVVQVALDNGGVDLPGDVVEVSLVLADDQIVQDLNREWRGKDMPTNVLSFPGFDDDQPDLPEGAPILLGDVILAYETCVLEAERDQITIQDHLGHLLVHGILHLLGYDHQTDDEAAEMEMLEIDILAQLGIANPYKEETHE